MSDDFEIIISDENRALTKKTSDIFTLIRESWKSRNLIERTKKLLLIDPSSACQKIFNASISDIREKIVIAGIDIAKYEVLWSPKLDDANAA